MRMRALVNQRSITLVVLAVVIAALPLVFPSSYYFRGLRFLSGRFSRLLSLIWWGARSCV